MATVMDANVQDVDHAISERLTLIRMRQKLAQKELTLLNNVLSLAEDLQKDATVDMALRRRLLSMLQNVRIP